PVHSTPAFQHTAEVGAPSSGLDQNARLPSGKKIVSCSLLNEQSASSVTMTTERIAFARRNPYDPSPSVVARLRRLYIDSRCSSNPQPLMPCGPRHWNACTVSSPSGRLVAPSMLSTHGLALVSSSESLVVAWIAMLVHSSGQTSRHA